ncbi:MAG: DUF1080 domain-containing protein [Candidatus Omnitrophota bacterium]
MKKSMFIALLAVAALAPAFVSAQDNPFIGRWALTIPGGGAGYLNIWQDNGYLDGDILWGGGSVVPVSSLCLDNDTLVIQRINAIQRKIKDPVRKLVLGNPLQPDEKGEFAITQQIAEEIIATVKGDEMSLTIYTPQPDGKKYRKYTFNGKRIPDLPPAPDLSKMKFGDPVVLLKTDTLEGWKLLEPRSANGWSVKDGVLTNNPVQERGKPHVSYGNLRTEAEFEDFNLTLEVNIPKGSNSGVYLRGIYEVQVQDDYGRDLDSHHMGAIYSRIRPTVAAEKPAGEWQSLDMTLCDRHATIILNGKMIIDNQPLLGCTGGAMTSNEFVPGPIYLQGDHGTVQYRNIVLKPIVK